MITLHQAQAMIAAGQAKAFAIGAAVNITVLDAGAHLKAFHRMDGAVLGAIDLSQGKARTAVLFDTASETVWEYCKPGAPAHGLELSNGGLTPFGGGVPIRTVEGTTVGAIGVSGGSVPQDVEIALAAVAAFTD